ncbi:hypothetical protein H0H81_006400 [Sphagnurus paluster]|uniref:DUF6697 domain-containing protein n=1 Tax=Sphagnurus paluster TaxID=117069 RepID=A0A9P7FXQ1_9AGAR|nr:hypothetical protein H0H81_006400 [Sphagnurus paluster]
MKVDTKPLLDSEDEKKVTAETLDVKWELKIEDDEKKSKLEIKDEGVCPKGQLRFGMFKAESPVVQAKDDVDTMEIEEEKNIIELHQENAEEANEPLPDRGATPPGDHDMELGDMDINQDYHIAQEVDQAATHIDMPDPTSPEVQSSSSTDAVPVANEDHSKQPKRRRFLMEAVEVPTIEAVLGRAIAKKDAIEVLNEKMEKLKNPNVKKKEGRGLSMDTVRDRLLTVGLDLYPIPLDKAIQDVTVTRKFLSAQYGGNTQATFPDIRKELLEEHGLDDFMYPNLDFNPHAPEMPGAPGLFFAAIGRPADDWPQINRVITRISSGIWQYQGQYKMTPVESLTKEEWAAQKYKVRLTWANEINEKGWGKVTRARIHLRKTLGRQFTREEFEEAMNSDNEYKEITPDEIGQAFIRGEETIAVWTMKCVDYDVDFQRNLAEKFPTWVPPPPKPKGVKNTGVGRKKAGRKIVKSKKSAKAKTGQKRKRVAVEELDSESDASTHNDDSHLEDDEAPKESVYKPRGTRSRPIVLEIVLE